ncbi:PREDICTED: B-box zinc finger protein 21-like [Nicotiana attenuata]|uniref:B-box zinc finger protein 21 n=1 Tax=Nicotiana attenuata TaxID=49451 RepID=A0A1J6I6M7_NICAT|nr:PREDICTED: B-box zinc finger protein 21-like [Nicotiana attenuata]OIT00170.1 b-box zinc finger protein 21 [Nicotiana attenuata]
MKMQCDVCNKNEASIFCVADEAALCDSCDHRVHHANKLAGKHQRFSLLQPSPKQVPLCDICQERRAFLFCQQDRAILCRECDTSIHKANEHTQKHNRFLLTGVKLSANSALYSSTESQSTTSSTNSLNTNQDSAQNLKSQTSIKKPLPLPVPVSVSVSSNISQEMTVAANDKGISCCNSQLVNVEANSLTSSISEYLEMLPGWHVEEFLNSSNIPNGFCKIGDSDMFPVWDTEIESNQNSFSPESIGIWVPQAPAVATPHQNQTQMFPPQNLNFGGQIEFKNTKEVTSVKSSRKWRDDNSFVVPQISPTSTSFKRSRTLW